jgi:hypothetical protein
MPKGEINRAFVFESLARSKSVLVVDTPNFTSSAWCRKELWFAEALSSQGRLHLKRSGVDDALAMLAQMNSCATSDRPRPENKYGYPVAPRIMTDFDYELRAPNRASACKRGLDVSPLVSVEELIGHNDATSAKRADTILGMLRAVASGGLATAETYDLWCAALQLTVAAISPKAQALSKMEVRNGVDRLNALVARIAEPDVQGNAVYRASTPRYLALAASAVLIELTGYVLDDAAIDTSSCSWQRSAATSARWRFCRRQPIRSTNSRSTASLYQFCRA